MSPGFLPAVPAYSNLVFARGDTLIAIRYALSGDSHAADLYRLNIGYIGTLMLGKVTPVAVRTDGSIVSIESDSNDTPRVVYRIVK